MCICVCSYTQQAESTAYATVWEPEGTPTENGNDGCLTLSHNPTFLHCPFSLNTPYFTVIPALPQTNGKSWHHRFSATGLKCVWCSRRSKRWLLCCDILAVIVFACFYRHASWEMDAGLAWGAKKWIRLNNWAFLHSQLWERPLLKCLLF